jgi:hypothetical protein
MMNHSPWFPVGSIYVVIFVLLILGTLWGLIASATREDWKWFLGILVAWFVGIGGIVGWVYVWRTRRRTQ